LLNKEDFVIVMVLRRPLVVMKDVGTKLAIVEFVICMVPRRGFVAMKDVETLLSKEEFVVVMVPRGQRGRFAVMKDAQI